MEIPTAHALYIYKQKEKNKMAKLVSAVDSMWILFGEYHSGFSQDSVVYSQDSIQIQLSCIL